MDVCITQLVTKVARVNYSREELVRLLDGIDNDRDLGVMSNRELAQLLVDAANDEPGIGRPVSSLWTELTNDSEGSEETIDVSDWEVTEVYGEGK